MTLSMKSLSASAPMTVMIKIELAVAISGGFELIAHCAQLMQIVRLEQTN